jgi:hypothetical protein
MSQTKIVRKVEETQHERQCRGKIMKQLKVVSTSSDIQQLVLSYIPNVQQVYEWNAPDLEYFTLSIYNNDGYTLTREDSIFHLGRESRVIEMLAHILMRLDIHEMENLSGLRFAKFVDEAVPIIQKHNYRSDLRNLEIDICRIIYCGSYLKMVKSYRVPDYMINHPVYNTPIYQGTNNNSPLEKRIRSKDPKKGSALQPDY